MTFTEGIDATNGVLQLAPAILQLIILLEGLFKTAPKSGAAKKAIVMATVHPALQEQVSSFVDTTVSAANAISADLSTLNNSTNKVK